MMIYVDQTLEIIGYYLNVPETVEHKYEKNPEK